MKTLPLVCALVLLSLGGLTSCDPGDGDATDTPAVDVSDGGGEVSVDGGSDVSVDADTTPSCPTAEPIINGACSGEGLQCDFGQECCCGQCYPSLSCTCSQGSWACFATDACFIPACPDVSDPDTTDTPDVPEPDTADASDADPSDADTSDADSGPADTTPDTGSACDSAQTALAAVLYKKTQAFTVTVRLDHNTLALLGYAILAGPYQSLDETAARAEASAKTSYGTGLLLSGPTPEDAWVFFESPGDFGGVGVVSAHTGQAAFGGSIVWDGTGDITWPTAWSEPSELGSGCDPSGGFGATRGFDLVSGTALDQTDIDAALAVVADTALPAAIWQGGYAFDAVVLRYPRSVGAFNPATAEWIVILGGGWLE